MTIETKILEEQLARDIYSNDAEEEKEIQEREHQIDEMTTLFQEDTLASKAQAFKTFAKFLGEKPEFSEKFSAKAGISIDNLFVTADICREQYYQIVRFDPELQMSFEPEHKEDDEVSLPTKEVTALKDWYVEEGHLYIPCDASKAQALLKEESESTPFLSIKDHSGSSDRKMVHIKIANIAAHRARVVISCLKNLEVLLPSKMLFIEQHALWASSEQELLFKSLFLVDKLNFPIILKTAISIENKVDTSSNDALFTLARICLVKDWHVELCQVIDHIPPGNIYYSYALKLKFSCLMSKIAPEYLSLGLEQKARSKFKEGFMGMFKTGSADLIKDSLKTLACYCGAPGLCLNANDNLQNLFMLGEHYYQMQKLQKYTPQLSICKLKSLISTLQKPSPNISTTGYLPQFTTPSFMPAFQVQKSLTLDLANKDEADGACWLKPPKVNI